MVWRAAILLAVSAALLLPAEAHSATTYPEAVLLVSGFQTEAPFTTPDAACNGKEGPDWGLPNGIAAALKDPAAPHAVFTAPVSRTGVPVPDPCPATGTPLPTANMVVNSNGETDDNGAALARLIAFLHDSYGVTDLHIVAHSDGGLWSRAAITQSGAYPGVTVQSLTTLGTPHTGSFLADLAVEVDGGKCDFSNPVEQRTCHVLLGLADLVMIKLGPTATRELGNDFLATWNPQQSIGNCPVSTIAGNHLDLGLPKLGYYTPSDGLVGLASAQATRAADLGGHPIPAPEIPGLREAGVYDVVHGAAVAFLSKKTLINQAEISAQVAQHTLLEGPEPCNLPPAASPSGAQAGAPNVQHLRAPLYRMVAADTHGRLPVPGPEDFAVSRRGVVIKCGSKALKPSPILGERRLRIHGTSGCRQRPRARKRGGDGPARALLLRSHPRRDVLMRIRGDDARIRVRGRAPKTLRAEARVGGSWKKLRLDRRGRTALPAVKGGSLQVRVRARGRARGVPADTANLTLAR